MIELKGHILKQLENHIPSWTDYYKTDFIQIITYNIRTNEFDDISDHIEANFTEEEIKNNTIKLIDGLDTEVFVTLCKLQETKRIDAYGSCHFTFNHKKYIIFNVYGDEDLPRDNDRIYTPCIVEVDNKMLHVWDILYKDGKYIIDNYKKGKARIVLENYGGKRAFFYHPEKNIVTLRGRKNRRSIRVK